MSQNNDDDKKVYVGYARVSTKDQNLDRQLKELKQQHCVKIFQEKMSGKDTNRPELHKMLNYIRDNDVVLVYSLDRLSRNYDDIKTIVELIKQKGAKLEVIDLPVTQTNNELVDKFMLDMMINLMSFVAENERQKIKERQRQGIAIAKEKGVYHGRQPKFTEDNVMVKQALEFYNLGNNKYPIAEIARRCNMSRSTLYRLLHRKGLID